MSGELTIPNGMRVVRDALRSLGYANAYDVPASPWLCEESVVISMTDWERESRQEDGFERGRRDLCCHIVCDGWQDARVTSREVAKGLAGFDWAHAECPERMRVVVCDVRLPCDYERDRSGRWIWDVTLTMTVVISNG